MVPVVGRLRSDITMAHHPTNTASSLEQGWSGTRLNRSWCVRVKCVCVSRLRETGLSCPWQHILSVHIANSPLIDRLAFVGDVSHYLACDTHHVNLKLCPGRATEPLPPISGGPSYFRNTYPGANWLSERGGKPNFVCIRADNRNKLCAPRSAARRLGPGGERPLDLDLLVCSDNNLLYWSNARRISCLHKVRAELRHQITFWIRIADAEFSLAYRLTLLNYA